MPEALAKGDLIWVRRYVVSGPSGDYSGQQPEVEFTGIIQHLSDGLIFVSEAEGGWFSADDVYLGGDPDKGTSRWYTTTVQLIKREGTTDE